MRVKRILSLHYVRLRMSILLLGFTCGLGAENCPLDYRK
jgi:hypothetical protein